MAGESYNPGDLSFLLSRRLDEDLSSAEREDLEAALRASPQLQREAEQLEVVGRLVARWAQQVPTVDLDAATGMLDAELSGLAADGGLARVDALLRRWGRGGRFVEDVGFAARVLEEIGGRRRVPARRLVLRVGVPLAAAAAIAVAVVGTWWFRPSGAVCQVVIGHRPTPTLAQSDVSARTIVSFASADESVAAAERPLSMGYMTIGAEALAGAEESSPL